MSYIVCQSRFLMNSVLLSFHHQQATKSITRKYQEELWQGRADMAREVLEEASALYQVCFMMSSGKNLNMAWKVAARELIAICNINMVRVSDSRAPYGMNHSLRP